MEHLRNQLNSESKNILGNPESFEENDLKTLDVVVNDAKDLFLFIDTKPILICDLEGFEIQASYFLKKNFSINLFKVRANLKGIDSLKEYLKTSTP